MVIMQDLAFANGCLKDSFETNGCLARSYKKIWQDDASSCKILQKSCKILLDNHSVPAGAGKPRLALMKTVMSILFSENRHNSVYLSYGRIKKNAKQNVN